MPNEELVTCIRRICNCMAGRHMCVYDVQSFNFQIHD